jgi:hypothetical protein
MFRKDLAAVAASLVLAGSSLTQASPAHAGSTISDKRYWPGDTRSGLSGYPPMAAFDSVHPSSSLQRRSVNNDFFVRPSTGNTQYRGGPKSPY